jgi:hypothetical protein
MENLPGRRSPISLVLDSSVTFEINEAVRHVFEAVAEHGALARALWRLEIANSLTMAVRLGALITSFGTLLEITTDSHWSQTLLLADQCMLAVYDGTRSALPASLATLDEKLRAGAIGCGAKVLGKSE